MVGRAVCRPLRRLARRRAPAAGRRLLCRHRPHRRCHAARLCLPRRRLPLRRNLSLRGGRGPVGALAPAQSAGADDPRRRPQRKGRRSDLSLRRGLSRRRMGDQLRHQRSVLRHRDAERRRHRGGDGSAVRGGARGRRMKEALPQGTISMARSDRVALLHMGGLGDLVLAADLLAALKAAGPAVTLICRADHGAIGDMFPVPPDRLVALPFDPHPWESLSGGLAASLRDVAAILSGAGADVLIDATLRAAWFGEFVAALLKPRHALCGRGEAEPLQNGLRRLVLGDFGFAPVPVRNFAVPPRLHERERYRRLAAACGLALKERQWTVPPPQREAARRRLAAHGLSPGGFIACSPGGAAATRLKRWPEANFRAVLETLGMPVLLLGAASDAAPIERLAAPLGALPAMVSVTTPEELPLAAALLAEARGWLANDSGLMHLAQAFGVPGVAIFGGGGRWPSYAPWNPRRRRPGAAVALLRLRLGLPARPCAVCRKRAGRGGARGAPTRSRCAARGRRRYRRRYGGPAAACAARRGRPILSGDAARPRRAAGSDHRQRSRSARGICRLCRGGGRTRRPRGSGAGAGSDFAQHRGPPRRVRARPGRIVSADPDRQRPRRRKYRRRSHGRSLMAAAPALAGSRDRAVSGGAAAACALPRATLLPVGRLCRQRNGGAKRPRPAGGNDAGGRRRRLALADAIPGAAPRRLSRKRSAGRCAGGRRRGVALACGAGAVSRGIPADPILDRALGGGARGAGGARRCAGPHSRRCRLGVALRAGARSAALGRGLLAAARDRSRAPFARRQCRQHAMGRRGRSQAGDRRSVDPRRGAAPSAARLFLQRMPRRRFLRSCGGIGDGRRPGHASGDAAERIFHAGRSGGAARPCHRYARPALSLRRRIRPCRRGAGVHPARRQDAGTGRRTRHRRHRLRGCGGSEAAAAGPSRRHPAPRHAPGALGGAAARAGGAGGGEPRLDSRPAAL
ncbi:MAG: glycosyltransferase family 9 protein [Rhodospirillaceae bacterium]|nr:glycosyltransferase family 9 protein [Rhodospirillaceae bacterium]